MNRPTDLRAITRAAAAFFVLLSLAAIAPGEAIGGCSDYILAMGGGHASGTLTRLDIFEMTGETPPVDRPRAPCSGASCRKGPTSSPIRVAPSTLRTDPWCSTAATAPLPATELFDTLRATTSLDPRHRGPSIDRPPRLQVAFPHS